MKKGLWALQTDTKKETEGTWIDHPKMDIRFKIRRTGGENSDFSNAANKVMRPYWRMMEGGKNKKPDEKLLKSANEKLAALYAEHVLMDWSGEDVVDEEGNALAFTVEAATKVLRDVPSLFGWVRDQAIEEDNFRFDFDLEEESGN